MQTKCMQRTFNSTSLELTELIGEKIGSCLKGGEVFNLVSDLGGGKTAFVRGLAKGFGSPDPVASPTFTISFTYSRADGSRLHHFDFYRLEDPGIVARELEEATQDSSDVVAVEWSDVVKDVLPADTIELKITAISESERNLSFDFDKSKAHIFDKL